MLTGGESWSVFFQDRSVWNPAFSLMIGKARAVSSLESASTLSALLLRSHALALTTGNPLTLAETRARRACALTEMSVLPPFDHIPSPLWFLISQAAALSRAWSISACVAALAEDIKPSHTDAAATKMASAGCNPANDATGREGIAHSFIAT